MKTESKAKIEDASSVSPEEKRLMEDLKQAYEMNEASKCSPEFKKIKHSIMQRILIEKAMRSKRNRESKSSAKQGGAG